jgi:GT2 family glycosyltransferase
MNGYPLIGSLRSFRQAGRSLSRPGWKPYNRSFDPPVSPNRDEWNDRVTVLIPTLERYPYLRNELTQLRDQTVRPLEIMVMDQTPAPDRDTSFPGEFSDLPLRVFFQETQGQCTGWNKGLLESRGDFILFLGDDADDIRPDFLESLLRTLHACQADMVACRVDELGALAIPSSKLHMQISDTFPIALIRRESLRASGLMDYAFDRGARADADLGLRCCKTGALMVYDPSIRVLHHHAPRGGLRAHKARVITRAKSRHSLFFRQVPTFTEIYLARRHFSSRKAREILWVKFIGTFSFKGNGMWKLLKVLISLCTIPGFVFMTWRATRQAEELLINFPKIPTFGDH